MEVGGVFGVIARGYFENQAGTGTFLWLLVATINCPDGLQYRTFGIILFLLWGTFKGGGQRVRVFISHFLGRFVRLVLGVFPGYVAMEASGRATLGKDVVGGLYLGTSINVPFYGVLVRENSKFCRFFFDRDVNTDQRLFPPFDGSCVIGCGMLKVVLRLFL